MTVPTNSCLLDGRADRQDSRQVGRLVGRQVGRQVDRLVGRQVGRQVGGLVGKQAGRQVGEPGLGQKEERAAVDLTHAAPIQLANHQNGTHVLLVLLVRRC